MVTQSLENLSKNFDNWLNAINRFIWPSQQNTDSISTTFYVFKALPKNLKSIEIKQWAELQANTLSPFINGDKYQYLSRSGLHLWVTDGKFLGVPETAFQNKLANGNYVVKGENHLYRQSWSNGHMSTCELIEPSNENDNPAENKLSLSHKTPWAVTRKIDKKMKAPSTWLGISFFIILCGLIWGVSGYITLTIQENNAEQEAQRLSDSLGDKLQQKTELHDNQRVLALLQTWHQTFGFVPETFGAVAEKLSLQGNWQANTLIWQNKTIEIEFVSKDVDITKLVGVLENIEILQQVNIRPHNSKNTWILEARLK